MDQFIDMKVGGPAKGQGKRAGKGRILAEYISPTHSSLREQEEDRAVSPKSPRR